MKTEADPNAAATQQQPPPPKPKEKTKEDLAAIEAWTDNLLGRDEESKKKDAEKEAARVEADKKAKAEKATAAGQKTDEEKAAEAAAAAEAKKRKPAAKPAAAAPAVDVTAISQAVADGIRAATAPKKPAANEDVVEFELPDGEKRKVAVLERMEKDMPEKYKDRAKQYVEQLKAAEKYAADWEKKNPGRAFDDNDPEHSGFFEAQDVDWNDDDFRDTEIAIAAERIVEKRMAPVNEEFENLKREKKLSAETPKIVAKRDEAAKEYWGIIGDDFGKLVKEDGSVDKTVYDALDKSDPIGLEVTLHYAEKVVEPVAMELYKLSEGLVEFDPKKEIHADIGAFATRQENEVAAMPPDQQIDGKGRRFATSEEWARLTPEQRNGRWFLSADKLTKLFTAEKANEAREVATAQREKIKKYSGAYAGQPPATTVKKPDTATAKLPGDDDDLPESVDGKPVSPSSVSAPAVAGQKKGGATGAEDKALTWATT